MIKKEISDKVIVVGTNPNGKGGVASVIKSHQQMMESFNFVKIHSAGIAKLFLPILGAIKSLRYLSGRYQVAHIHSSSFSDFYRSSLFVILFKILGKKIIIQMHGAKFDEFYGSGKKYVKKIFRMADMVLSVSYYYAKFMQDNHLNENVECLHNGITGRNKDYIPPTKSDLVKFSYFGAIDNRKGIFDVLETIGENRDKLAGKIKLTIGGVGDMSKFNAIVEKYDLNNIVEYSGWLDKNAKDKLLSTTDVFIHPSHSESFGISILEAMDYGLPIITTSIGGIPDLVTDGINGIIVTPGDRQQIMSAMMKLISDEKLRIKLGANSIIAAKKFYLPEIETHLNALYQSVIGYNYNTNDKHIK